MSVYYQDSHVTIYHGDCRAILPTLDAASIQCCVTSPPYFGLRDYSGDAQIGLEATPAAYVAEMTGVFGAVRRVLRPDGTLWLNLGDSYAGGATDYVKPHTGADLRRAARQYHTPATTSRKDFTGLKPKDLIGIPWRVAFALQDAGWWLRSDIIWAKGNPMPESVTDRPTKAHEYLFLMAVAERYYYDADAIREPHARDWAGDHLTGAVDHLTGLDRNGSSQDGLTASLPNPAGRNKRSVWSVNTQPYSGAHFAVFPEKLIEPCILAGCPVQSCAVCGAPWLRVVEREPAVDPGRSSDAKFVNHTDRNDGKRRLGAQYQAQLDANPPITTGFAPSCHCAAATVPGIVLDPFGGSGTVGVVAKRFNRRAILIEQNIDYCRMAADRLEAVTMPLPLEVV